MWHASEIAYEQNSNSTVPCERKNQIALFHASENVGRTSASADARIFTASISSITYFQRVRNQQSICCRSNIEQIRQSRLDSSLHSQLEFLKTFQVVHLALESGPHIYRSICMAAPSNPALQAGVRGRERERATERDGGVSRRSGEPHTPSEVPKPTQMRGQASTRASGWTGLPPRRAAAAPPAVVHG